MTLVPLIGNSKTNVSGVANEPYVNENKFNIRYDKITEIGEYGSSIQSLAWSRDGNLLAIGGVGNTVFELWDITKKLRIWQLQKPIPDLSHSLAFTNEDRYLVVSSALSQVAGATICLSIIDVESGRVIHNISAPAEAQKFHIATSWAVNDSANRLVASVNPTKFICVFDTTNWSLVRLIPSRGLQDRAFSFDLATGFLAAPTLKLNSTPDKNGLPEKNGVEIWNIETGTLVHNLKVSEKVVTSLVYLAKNKGLVTGSQGEVDSSSTAGNHAGSGTSNAAYIYLWDPVTFELRSSLRNGVDSPNILSITGSRDGDLIAAALGGGRLRVWSSLNAELLLSVDWRNQTDFLNIRTVLFHPSELAFAFNLNNGVYIAHW